MTPFSPNYKPQVDTKAIKASSASSRSATASRAARMQSKDPEVRAIASGFIPGVSTKSDPANADRIKRGNSRVGA